MLTTNSVKALLNKLSPHKIIDVTVKPDDNKNARVSFLQKSESQRVNVKALIKIQLILKHKDLYFTPDIDKFWDAMEAVTASFIDNVVAVPKLITHVTMDTYFLI